MADRERRSSSEDNLSVESDVENSVVLVEQSGLRPYQFDPQRVQQNNTQEASPEPYDKNSLDRLGNTDWY